MHRLVSRLGHRFLDPELLERALTHRSATGLHNERLEFLGDAVLGFLISDELFRRFGDAREGDLTRLRARLVREATLAQLARGIGLGEELRLGGGELKSGGRDRDSILADALEAVLGAVYLDAGIERCRSLILDLYGDLLSSLDPGQVEKDPKTRLQEWLQGRRLPLPAYAVVVAAGDGREAGFAVTCEVPALGLRASGEGANRRVAEQVAAAALLRQLSGEPAGSGEAAAAARADRSGRPTDD
ncbi:MAG: ribonuclease III [Gammaproteobacteria bacterium]|nr:ribonuclease III [Gammaproteobacteria bacterium]